MLGLSSHYSAMLKPFLSPLSHEKKEKKGVYEERNVTVRERTRLVMESTECTKERGVKNVLDMERKRQDGRKE